jgi:hypothetical protein
MQVDESRRDLVVSALSLERSGDADDRQRFEAASDHAPSGGSHVPKGACGRRADLGIGFRPEAEEEEARKRLFDRNNPERVEAPATTPSGFSAC